MPKRTAAETGGVTPPESQTSSSEGSRSPRPSIQPPSKRLRVEDSNFITLHEEISELEKTEHHFPSLVSFINGLNTACQAKWNTRDTPYNRVIALLVHWEEDDLGVTREIGALRAVLRNDYQFDVDSLAIPSTKRGYLSLGNKIQDILSEYDAEDNLFILYYGGHARRDEGQPQPTWVSNRRGGSSFNSSSFFHLFNDMDADLLLLLDSCQALPRNFDSTGKGVAAAITATGFEHGPAGIAPGVGSHSFTHALVEVLGRMSIPPDPGAGERQEPICDVSLHAFIVEELRASKPALERTESGELKRDTEGRLKLEPYQRRTPHRYWLSRNKSNRTIRLLPLRGKEKAMCGQSSFDTISKTKDSRPRCKPVYDAVVPEVLVAIRLEPDALSELDIDAWTNWALTVPSNSNNVTFRANAVTIEGLYRSYSSLIILRMSLEIWSLLPKQRAMTFIGYVKGGNHAAEVNSQVDEAVSRKTSVSAIVEHTTVQPQESKPVTASPSNTYTTYHEAAFPLDPTSDHLPVPQGYIPQDCVFLKNEPSPEDESEIDLSATADIVARRQELMDLLSFDGICTSIGIDTAHNNTWKWFPETDKYRQWLDLRNRENHHGFLWIKGSPGSGKLTLINYLVKGARLAARNDPNRLVASCFFSALAEVRDKSTVTLYQSLLWQLLQAAPDLQEVLDQVCKGYGWNMQRFKLGWSGEILQETIERTVDCLGERDLSIFIEAPDEFPDDEIREMVLFFKSLCERASGKDIRLRICLASRHHPVTASPPGLVAELEDQDTVDDSNKSRFLIPNMSSTLITPPYTIRRPLPYNMTSEDSIVTKRNKALFDQADLGNRTVKRCIDRGGTEEIENDLAKSTQIKRGFFVKDTDVTVGDYLTSTATAKIIPKVRECNVFRFKNRFDPERDGRFAVDVLVSGPLLSQELQEELHRRDILSLKKPPKLATRILDDKSMKKAVGMGNVYVDRTTNALADGIEWIRRIRLQSPALIRILAQYSNERWDSSPRTYYRPFDALIFHHPKMCETLAELEERWGAQVDAEEGQNASNDDDNESQGRGDGPDYDDSDDMVNSPEALKCLRAYVKYIDENILPDYHKYEKMDVRSPNANVRFSDLWYLFRTGELVYRQVDGELPDRRDFRAGKRIWKTFYVDPVSEREMAAFTDVDKIGDTAMKNNQRTFRLGCYYIDYNGEDFFCVTTEVKIQQFSGEMPINSLPIYPIRFCQDWEGRLAQAIDTGQGLINFIQVKHCSYSGWTLTRNPTGEPTIDANGKLLEHPEYIDSEVMIDFAEAFQQCPQWCPPRASMLKKIVDGLTLPEEFKIKWWSGDDRAILLGETTEQTPVRSGVAWKQRNAFVSQDPFLSRVAENVKNGRHTTVEHLELGRDTKALLTGRVFAYVFQERKFAQLAADKLRPSPKTGLPLHSLRIPDTIKHVIQGCIQGHFRQKNAERRRDQEWVSLDLIEGKGSGLFILLHGVPGVGKTATAEAIAKANGKPLFKITVGDLGMTPVNLEASLREIFRLASIWDCILLLDEVDTFFSARSKGDAATAKNGLVSEFLRVLDYYDGILFLTTNRAGVLDEAFKSRIHFKIYYPNLSLEQTIDIWKLNIERTRQFEEKLSRAEGRPPLEIEDKTLLDFAEFHYKEAVKQGKGGQWNGRQIRNAFQVARSLAFYEHGVEEEKRLVEAARRREGGVIFSSHRPPKLKVSHFTTMQELTDSFEKYLGATRGGSWDTETAFDSLDNEYRYDRFKDEFRHDQFKNPLTEGLQNTYRKGYYHSQVQEQTGAEERMTGVLLHQHHHDHQKRNHQMGNHQQGQGQLGNNQRLSEVQPYTQQRYDQNSPSNGMDFPPSPGRTPFYLQ